MNALTLIIITLCIFALAYRHYDLFIANKVLGLDSRRTITAHILDVHRDNPPTNKYVLLGHHFAAIAVAGPLSGLVA
jgi:carbon starvation protein